jgi:DNA repair exonuclease SbcCD nuclease subunit
MKIVQSSDWHLDTNTAGFRRYDDVSNAVRATVEAAIDLNAEYYLFTGDAHDPDGGGDTYMYSRFIMQTAIYLADAGIKSIWLPGNHCVCENGNGLTVLSPLRSLVESQKYERFITLAEDPGYISLGGKALLCALPFTSFDRPYDPAEVVRNIPAGKLPVIVAGHLMIEGIEIGSETSDFPRGRDIFFPQQACDDLAKGREVMRVQGHYHKKQCFEGIYIPGSVARLTFGEEEHSPGYQVIEV